MLPEGTPEARQWRLAWDALRRVEGVWDDPAARGRAIQDARVRLDDGGAPRLRRLAALLAPDMPRQAFLAVLVPVERVAARTRITDAEMGVSGEDGGTPAPFPLTVVADSLRSAFNTGGVFRTADALGAAAIWLCGYTATPEHAHVARAALGAERALPWRRWDNVRAAVTAARVAGAAVYALETCRVAAPVEECDFRFPCALLLGGERFGLDPDVLADADARLRIAMYGTKNSLNVVAALAVAGYAARRCWHRKAGRL